PDTWIQKSHYGPSDYRGDEGLPDWEAARERPQEAQFIRAYLVLPTEKQTRTVTDYDRMGRMIRDAARDGVQDDLEVRPGEGDEVLVSSGHRRRFAGVNAGAKFFLCKLNCEAVDPLIAQRRMIKGNEFREELNPVDRAMSFVTYLQ